MSVALANLRSWLSWHYWDDGAGRALIEGLAETADALSDLLRQALRVRFPSRAPVDALGEIAWNQNVDPPTDLIGVPTTRAYLADPWSKWRAAGTRGRFLDPAALFGELALLGLTNCQIVSWRDLSNGGNPGAFGGDSSCWYLQILQPNPFTPPHTWDDGGLWDGGEHWDFEGPIERILGGVDRAIDRWKPAVSSCRFYEIHLTDGTSVVIRPKYEWWEIGPDGNAIGDYYNHDVNTRGTE